MMAFPLPTNQQSAESVMPTIRTLDYPATWLPMNAAHHRRFATPARMTDDTPRLDPHVDDLVVVALVETQIHRPVARAWGIPDRRVERRQRHLHVRDVRAADGDAQRHTTLVGEYVPFCAGFGSICGVAS